MVSSEAIISVDHVSIDFRKEKEDLPVLVDVSFQAFKNEFVNITGPSGAANPRYFAQ